MSAKVSSSQKAYKEIRSLLINFELRPSEKINEVILAQKFGISRTPLREALNHLVAEGLLEMKGRGLSVPNLDPSVIKDLFEARTEVESSTVVLSCQRASDEELGQLEKFIEESVSESPDTSVDRLVDLDRIFHESIASLSRNRELLRTLQNFNDRIHLIRWVAMDGKRSTTQAEHQEILKYIQQREPTLAVQAMRNHILHRNDEIIAAIKSAFGYVNTLNFA